MKKLKGRWFDTTEEIRSESQIARHSRTEKEFQKSSQNGGDGGTMTGIYIRKGTASRVMVADRSYGEFYDFYIFSPEYFG
jgi:hypothetical protein